MEERLLPASRRPDGTLRKAVRIRAGYVPQEEVALYQSKGTLWKNSGSEAPPGFDPDTAHKPKTKATKKNEKRNEKRKQAKLNSSEPGVEAMTEQLTALEVVDPPTPSAREQAQTGADGAEEAGNKTDVDKKIRALKKKIRLARNEAQTAPEKLSKLHAWENELRDLESSIV